MGNKSLLLFVLVIITACDPLSTTVTTAPAVILGIHDQSIKRQTWLERAEEGDVYSQYELAQSYCCAPNEGEINNKEALRWFCVAAQNGFAKAQIDVGNIYSGTSAIEDPGVSLDKVTAYVWYRKAAKRGLSEAAKLAWDLERDFSVQEMQSAESLLVASKALKCFDEEVFQPDDE